MHGHEDGVRRLADRVAAMARTTNHQPDADAHEVHTLDRCPFAFEQATVAGSAEIGPWARLCAWCASRGSGLPELDDAAYVVLVLLRAMGVAVARVRWSDDIAEFMLRNTGNASCGRASAHGLIDTDHAELARSLARQHYSLPG